MQRPSGYRISLSLSLTAHTVSIPPVFYKQSTTFKKVKHCHVASHVFKIFAAPDEW
jgi:hypothetical protein